MFSFLHTTEVIQIPPHLPVDALVVCLCVCVGRGAAEGKTKKTKMENKRGRLLTAVSHPAQ